MNNQLLLTFRPHDPYFFGGEQTFGALANYYAQSNLLPQQSTLCGIIRHLLLNQGYQRGDDSFQPDNPSPNTGDLISLSPLFLVHNNRFFLPAPFDRQTARQPFELENKAEKAEAAFTSFHAAGQGLWKWKGYDHKAVREDAWISQDGNECIDSEKIFIPLTRPGITKVRQGQQRSNEDGFYKQLMYALAPGWSFGVLADFTTNVKPEILNGTALPAGAEKTVFSISAKAEPRAFKDIFKPLDMFYHTGKPADGFARVVLTSDACISPSAYQLVVAGMTDTVDFRHINTSPRVTRYGPMTTLSVGEKLDPLAAQMQKSAKYTLLRRGSVLVVDTAGDALKNLIGALEIKPWTTYGFNQYFTIQ